MPVAGCVKIPSVCHCSKGWHVLRSEKQTCTSNPSSQLGLKCKIPRAGRGDLLPCRVSKEGAEALIQQLLPLPGSASKSMLASLHMHEERCSKASDFPSKLLQPQHQWWLWEGLGLVHHGPGTDPSGSLRASPLQRGLWGTLVSAGSSLPIRLKGSFSL